MKDLVEYIVKQLVSNPDAVMVEESTDGTNVDLLLKVDPADMGIVIGKSGQTIKSIRKLLLVKAISDGVRVNLQLHDEGKPIGGVVNDQSQESSEEPTDSTSQAPQDDTTETNEKGSESSEETPQEETPNPSIDAQAIGSEPELRAQARRDNKE